jgi:hypothetical protein
MVFAMATSIEQLQLLRESGLGQAQAEAILLVVEQKHEELATKEDIDQLRAATKEDIDRLYTATKEDIDQLRAATKGGLDELRAATKGDIDELRVATKEDIDESRVATKEDIDELRAATKGDVNELRQWSLITFATQVQLAEVKVDLIKWIVGMAISTIGIGLAGVYFLLSHFKP